MKLRILPAQHNAHPIKGLLIKGENPTYWIQEIQRMFVRLEQVRVYPVPGMVANSVWGCFVAFYANQEPKEVGAHMLCQFVHDAVFIPVFTKMLPQISPSEKGILFRESEYVFHPDFGWYELTDEIDWDELLDVPSERAIDIVIPESSVEIPNIIKSFQLREIAPEEILFELEMRPADEMPLKPLSGLEKVKLNFLKKMFNSDGDQKLPKAILNSEKYQKLRQDFEELEKRNRKELDKLMGLINEDPENVLRYAVPLDSDGLSRTSGVPGAFKIFRNSDFSLFGNRGGGGGGGFSIEEDQMVKLSQKYQQAAKDLIKDGKFLKASYVYLNLLKNKELAVATLKSGGLYAEAAAVYLNLMDDKKSAAECFHKAHMTEKAIELYDELELYELAGDLSQEIGHFKQANKYYFKEIDRFRNKEQYVKASLIFRKKLNDIDAAKELLLVGWNQGKNREACLRNYFAYSEDPKEKLKDILSVNQTINDVKSAKLFLTVIKPEYWKNESIQKEVLDIVYGSIVSYKKKDASIIRLLNSFIQDGRVKADVLAYVYRDGAGAK